MEEGGADVGVHDRWGNTPLDEALRVNATLCVNFLKSKGAPTNVFVQPPAASS